MLTENCSSFNKNSSRVKPYGKEINKETYKLYRFFLDNMFCHIYCVLLFVLPYILCPY